MHICAMVDGKSYACACVSEMFGRRFADLLLFCVTSTELVILVLLTPTFTIADWIYVLQHLIVLGVALTRPPPNVRDYSITTSMAVGAAYIYPYAQIIYLHWSPGYVVWPEAGRTLVTLAAGLSLVTFLALGSLFGVRPALRGLVKSGPYRFVRVLPAFLACKRRQTAPRFGEFSRSKLCLRVTYPNSFGISRRATEIASYCKSDFTRAGWAGCSLWFRPHMIGRARVLSLRSSCCWRSVF